MRFFDYIDTIEKPTVENIRAIYRAISTKSASTFYNSYYLALPPYL